jgi:hypothetical protein
MCLITLLSCYNISRVFGTLVLSYEFLFTTARTLCHYVCRLDSSYACDCTLVPMATPLLNHIAFLTWIKFTLVHSHPSGSHFCHCVQMDHPGYDSADVEAWTLVNYLVEGGFPALLWDTLKDFEYSVYPEYSTREVMTTGQLLRCEVKVKIPVCLTNPSWEEWECKAQGRNLADTVQKAALEALTTFCGKHCRCLNLSTSMGGTHSKVEGGDRHDLEPEGTREDTTHEIYTGSGSRSSYPTSCLE